MPSRLEPTGMSRADGKHPDGATVVPWSRGQLLVWDVTCPDTLATSYRCQATCAAGKVQLLPKRGKSASMPTLAKHTSLRQWPSKHWVPLAQRRWPL